MSIRELLFYILPLILIPLSLFVGPSNTIDQSDIYHWLVYRTFGVTPPASLDLPMVETVILEIRLPRVITAFLVGAALTTSGASLQAIIRNPLVEPYLLGLSSGAAFGAALAMTRLALPVQASAFLFGLLAVSLTYFLAIRRGEVSILSMILSGVIVSGLFTSGLTIVQFLTDPFRLQGIVYWIMGNLHNSTWSGVKSVIAPIIIGFLL
ncbi:MAG: iron ABC transporter permease, partial [Thermodesulfovibrionales bacterium]|nr:iron ABC transporter permease [Thermodesulfovibrionales bacterium]